MTLYAIRILVFGEMSIDTCLFDSGAYTRICVRIRKVIMLRISSLMPYEA